ncbi:MAG: hypothetical protein DRQ88_04145 [Epsilonproteobacteria bacterium]|nr:MAG: hypothetical protein DRQ89_00580 [Campylobacterota bacterium]RLA67091.1 MAG: hypothetical protein DRQ88_04145 [Campylobacterota bacterium]
MEFDQLKEQVKKIEGSFKSNLSGQKDYREIIYYEGELLKAQVEKDFKIPLSELSQKMGDNSDPELGNHGHKRSDYVLGWEKVEDSFTFTLENIKRGKKLKLVKCPPVFFPHLAKLLPVFVEEMATSA